MDILRIQDLEELIALNQDLFISIYLPTYSSGADIRQNSTRFKQLLRVAEAELYNLDMRKGQVEEFLKPATNLIGETRFWQNQSDGLALFIHQEGIKHFRLPVEFKETITVSNKLYIKPLLPLFTGNGQFNLLALSKNDFKLFRCTRQDVREIVLQDAPNNILDMQVDYDPRTNLVLRTSNPTAINRLPSSQVTQGQGNENDYEKNELTRYFRAIDKSLLNFQEGKELPLVLAAVDYLVPIYREKSNYPYIVEEYIKGNPEILDENQLHKLAWEIMEPIFGKEEEDAKEKYKQYTGQDNKLVLNSLDKIILAAYSGQIESLFLDNNIYKWGKHDLENNRVKINEDKEEGDEDLMEYASILTLSRGGNVFSLDTNMEQNGGFIGATLRY